MKDFTKQENDLIEYGYDEAIKDVKTVLARLHLKAKQKNKLAEMKYINNIVRTIELL